jgi:TonB family protein
MLSQNNVARDFSPWLLLAIIVHAATIFGFRAELVQRPAATPTMLEVSLLPEIIEANPPPAPTSVGQEHAAFNEQSIIIPPPAAAPVQRHATPPQHVSGWNRRNDADPAPALRSQRTSRASPPLQPKDRDGTAATDLESAKSEPEEGPPLLKATSDSAVPGAGLSDRQRRREAAGGEGNSGESAAPVRLTAAALGQQISEWSAEYTKALPSEAAEPPRTGKIEKVASNRIAAAAYERAWQDKVERVGNMNYPEDARRRNLTGALMLSVGVNADGTIHGIQVRKSSGYEELDQAAIRIVRLAAPFSAFPAELTKDYDVLWITRTWRFFNDNHFATMP